MQQVNKVNHKVTVDALIKHPLDALVEYPEMGATTKQSIAHIFRIDPALFIRPESEFQYSLGLLGSGTCSRLVNVFCKLLCDNTGNPVCSKRVKTLCRCLIHFLTPLSPPGGITGNGLKIYTARGPNVPMQSHSYVNQLSMWDLIAPSPFSYVDTTSGDHF